MTYDEAISFFSQHGNVSSDPDRLRTLRPTESQLLGAVDYAVMVKKQPLDKTRQAMTVILANHRERA